MTRPVFQFQKAWHLTHHMTGQLLDACREGAALRARPASARDGGARGDGVGVALVVRVVPQRLVAVRARAPVAGRARAAVGVDVPRAAGVRAPHGDGRRVVGAEESGEGALERAVARPGGGEVGAARANLLVEGVSLGHEASSFSLARGGRDVRLHAREFPVDEVGAPGDAVGSVGKGDAEAFAPLGRVPRAVARRAARAVLDRALARAPAAQAKVATSARAAARVRFFVATHLALHFFRVGFCARHKKI